MFLLILWTEIKLFLLLTAFELQEICILHLDLQHFKEDLRDR